MATMKNRHRAIEQTRKQLLRKSGDWFKDKIIKNHINNTEKLADAANFNLNPLIVPYLSVFLTGKVTPTGIAKALIYPRVLGTSITTSFGTNVQGFISDVLSGVYGSTTEGIDIEFEDQRDKRRKYGQIKLGPNCLNKDDIATIHQHFQALRRRANTNRNRISDDCLVVGVIYGAEHELSAAYKTLREEHHYSVYVGAEFWERLTGDPKFYSKLTKTIARSLEELSSQSLLTDVISKLAKHEDVIDLMRLAGRDDRTLKTRVPRKTRSK
jgi:hypothetical protein